MLFLVQLKKQLKEKINFKMKFCFILTLIPLVLSKSLENDQRAQLNSEQ